MRKSMKPSTLRPEERGVQGPQKNFLFPNRSLMSVRVFGPCFWSYGSRSTRLWFNSAMAFQLPSQSSTSMEDLPILFH